MTDPSIVPQRLVLVLPSTGEFDSRTWRIARTVAARGHEVTVVARAAAGLPRETTLEGGGRLVRVVVSTEDGLPGPLRAIARRSRRGRGSASPAVPGANAANRPQTPAPRRAGLAAKVRRGVAGAWRLAAIGLTVRSQTRATLRVAPPADVVHAMAYMGIPVGLALGRRDGARAVYDARDIYTDARNMARLPGPARRLFAAVERRWAHRADLVVTVNEPYADVLAAKFGTRPTIVMNCSVARPLGAAPERRFHAALGLPAGRRVVLYHGGLSPDRGIEQLLVAIRSVEDATLVLMGYGELERSLDRVAADPASGGRVAVLPAVPPAELIDWVASADVVAMPIQPSTLNHRLTTPNKLFEAIAAGVPVVASDLPGMATIVRATGCGVLVDPTDPAAIAAGLREVLDADPTRAQALRDGVERAHATYTWETQADVLLRAYGRLTGRPW